MSMYYDVGLFHRRFGLPVFDHRNIPGGNLTAEVIDFRIKFMQEELDEFKEAAAVNDLPRMADALVDLAYVALGTAHFLSLPWLNLWLEVHHANMRKERATHPSQSKRGSGFDVIKPPGWVPPDVAGVLRAFGWPG